MFHMNDLYQNAQTDRGFLSKLEHSWEILRFLHHLSHRSAICYMEFINFTSRVNFAQIGSAYNAERYLLYFYTTRHTLQCSTLKHIHRFSGLLSCLASDDASSGVTD
eukprot:5227745-Amphidinium_carterae.1